MHVLTTKASVTDLPPVSLDQSNVFMYYGLSNFYQNHRRYVKSRDDSQLNGNMVSLKVRLVSEGKRGHGSTQTSSGHRREKRKALNAVNYYIFKTYLFSHKDDVDHNFQ